MTPRVLYGALARAEAVTWGLLLLGMLFKYVLADTSVGVQVAGPVHGFVFLAFGLVTLLLAVDARWSWRRTLTGLAAGVVPFASVPFERAAERAEVLPARWRLREQRGSGGVERLVGSALRSPVPAALVALVVLGLVFAGLLALGPPTRWVG